MLNQILRPIARRAIQKGAQQTRLAHHESNFKYVTLDEACHPQGPWKENFEKQQRKYNMHLIVGVAMFVGTCVAINRFELLFFNYAPPTPKQ